MRSPLVDFQSPCSGKALLADVAPEPVREVNDVGVRVSVVVVLKHLVAMPALHLQLLPLNFQNSSLGGRMKYFEHLCMFNKLLFYKETVLSSSP